MKKMIRSMRFTNMLGILACVITYITAFSAFDKEEIVSAFDDYEYYTMELIISIYMTGVIATCFVVGYVVIDKIRVRTAHIINAVMGTLGLITSVFSIRQGSSLYNMTLFGGETVRAETISNAHAICFVVMSYILLIVSILHILNVVINLFLYKKYLGDYGTESKRECEMWSFMPQVLVFILIFSTTFCLLCLYGIYTLVFLIPYTVAFAVPVSIWFLSIVVKWENEKKYIKVAISYIVYIITVYGVTDCLFYKSVGGFYIEYSLEDVLDTHIVGILNVVAGALGLIVLIVNALKRNKEQGVQ